MSPTVRRAGVSALMRSWSAASAGSRATSATARRYFAEGGGGIQTGPIGFEISAKFGWNRLSEPVEHRFLTVPVNMRATVSF